MNFILKAYASAAGPILCARRRCQKQACVSSSWAVRRRLASCSQIAPRIAKLLKIVIIRKAMLEDRIWTVFTFL